MTNKISKPVIDYARTLPSEIISIFNDYITKSYDKCFLDPIETSDNKNIIYNADKAAKTNPAHKSKLLSPNALWQNYDTNISFLRVVFEDDEIAKTWKKLLSENESKTVLLARILINLNSEYQYERELISKPSNEIKRIKQLYVLTYKYWDKLRKYDDLEFDYILGDKYTDLRKALDSFLDNPSEILEDLEVHMSETIVSEAKTALATRENMSNNAKAIFFMRKLNKFFKANFGLAMLNETADFLQLLFNKNYTSSEITNYCRK